MMIYKNRLEIFLTDPQPWNAKSENQAVSILPLFSTSLCTESLHTVDEYPKFMPIGAMELESYAAEHNAAGEKKYHYTIACQDDYPPASNDLSPGVLVWVYSTLRLSVLCNRGKAVKLRHSPVPDSMMFIDPKTSTEKSLDNHAWNHSDQILSVAQSGFVVYRPIFFMKVKSFQYVSEEGDHRAQWKLSLYEA